MKNRSMMPNTKQKRQMFVLYVLFLMLLSLSIAFMHLSSKIAETFRAASVISGACFWIGFIGTVVTAVRINHFRKRSALFKGFQPKQKKLGLIHFFQNKTAKFFDILMFISLVSFLIFVLFVKNNAISFVFLSIFVFSFGMHCMLNGTNYEYIIFRAKKEVKS